MAKKTKSPAAPAKANRELPPLVKAIDEQYQRGNFAGVRQLAAKAGELDEESRRHVDALVEKTRTDPRAWIIGVVSLVIVIIVAASTLA